MLLNFSSDLLHLLDNKVSQ